MRIKCSKCGRERDVAGWCASQATCPACGKSLQPEIRAAAMTLEAILGEIVSRFGPEILQDGGRTIAMFSDLAPQMRKEKILLSYLIQGNGHIQLLEARQLDDGQRQLRYQKVVRYLTEEQFVERSAAENVCLSFLNALGTKLEISVSEPPVFSGPAGIPDSAPKAVIRTYGQFMNTLEQRFLANGGRMLSQQQMADFLSEFDLISRFGLQTDEVEAALKAIAARKQAGQDLVDLLTAQTT